MEEVHQWFEYTYSHYQLGLHIFSPIGLGDEQVHSQAQFCLSRPEKLAICKFQLQL
jgi:hypothetical protein